MTDRCADALGEPNGLTRVERRAAKRAAQRVARRRGAGVAGIVALSLAASAAGFSSTTAPTGAAPAGPDRGRGATADVAPATGSPTIGAFSSASLLATGPVLRSQLSTVDITGAQLATSTNPVAAALPTPRPIDGVLMTAAATAAEQAAAAAAAAAAEATRVAAAKLAPHTGVNWDSIASCETGGNWRMSGSSFSGGLGFANTTWRGFGGGEFASNAGQASREQQIVVAERVYARHGLSGWGCRRFG